MSRMDNFAAIRDLSPVWDNMADLFTIYRRSGHESMVINLLCGWADANGFKWKKDAKGNLVIYVPGKNGMEDLQPVIIQNHVDMVREEAEGENLERDGVQAEIQGDWVSTFGKTTAGFDNGLGLSMALALAFDPKAKHPPLEIVCTVEEEIGLYGALALDGSLLRGRKIINLDSEDQKELFTSCAGGGYVTVKFPQASVEMIGNEDMILVEASLQGGEGGHSGCDIHLGRLNPVIFLGMCLEETAARLGAWVFLSSLEGGDPKSINKIPKWARARFYVKSIFADDFLKTLEAYFAEMKRMFRSDDLGYTLKVEKQDGERPLALDGKQTEMIFAFLLNVPNGVIAMSDDVEGLVETSSNLGAGYVEAGQQVFKFLPRSSVNDSLYSVRDQILELAAEQNAVEAVSEGFYPGWKADPDSQLLKTALVVTERLFGRPWPAVNIHAGLEAGVVKTQIEASLPDGSTEKVDAISFGPQIDGAHSVNERASISSTAESYQFLVALVEELGNEMLQGVI